MGTICHHAIVVTGSSPYIESAHAEATDRFITNLSPLGPVVTNGYRSFCIFPDGSKEGWDESEEGDTRRHDFIAWMNRQRFSDGSTPLEWVEVEYGERPRREGAAVTRHFDNVNIGDDYDGPADLETKGA